MIFVINFMFLKYFYYIDACMSTDVFKCIQLDSGWL